MIYIVEKCINKTSNSITKLSDIYKPLIKTYTVDEFNLNKNNLIGEEIYLEGWISIYNRTALWFHCFSDKSSIYSNGDGECSKVSEDVYNNDLILVENGVGATTRLINGFHPSLLENYIYSNIHTGDYVRFKGIVAVDFNNRIELQFTDAEILSS